MTDDRKLDAYGHMTWTVGDDDWLACFDAIRTTEGIAYHVVVNCESGGWIDILDSGTVPANEAVDKLGGLPSFWADTYYEQGMSEDVEDPMTPEQVTECEARWRKHLTELAAMPPAPEPDEEPSDPDAELRKAALDHRGMP